MAGATTISEQPQRRPRPEMDVELSRAASQKLSIEKASKTPKATTRGVKSRDLPGTPETEGTTTEDAPAPASAEGDKKESVTGAPESIDDFIVDTAGKVGVKEDQVKTVTEKVMELVSKHSPAEVVQTISDKVPGADKYLSKLPIPKKDEDKNDKQEEDEEEAKEEDGDDSNDAEDKDEGDNEEGEKIKTRAAPNLPTEQDDNKTRDAGEDDDDEDDDDDGPPTKKTCLPSCLQNLLDKATGGKTPTDAKAVLELVGKAGITPDKAGEIVTKLLDFLKGKIGEDKVNQITSKVPGLNSLIQK